MTADYLSVIKPYAANNYGINSSFETWVAGAPYGWAAIGVPTITQDSGTAYIWRGVSSCKIVSIGGWLGIFQDVSGTNGQNYRCSAYVYVASGVATMTACDYGGSNNPVTVYSSGTGWQRLELTKVAANTGLRLMFRDNNGAATFYVDCVQVEDGTATTTYIDGDEPGCYFNGSWHASTSTRSDQTREGGQIVGFNTIATKIIGITGAGMPPFRNVSMPFGLVGGSIHQRTVKQARVFEVELLLQGTSLDNLHSKFRSLEDLVKYDLVTPEQPLKMLYTDLSSATTLFIHAVYDAGLEGIPFDGLPTSKFEKCVLRFIADDPCWYDEKQSVQVLGAGATTFYQAVANPYAFLQRKAGVWTGLNFGGNHACLALAYGFDGGLYAGGIFDKVGNAAANDLTVNGVAKWQNNTWSAMGTGVAGGTARVYAMAIAPDGSLVIGGDFTSVDGVGDTAYIARWDGSWHAYGSGMDGAVRAVAFDRNGVLIVGGDFAHGNGVAAAKIAKWAGGTFVPYGSGMDSSVFSIAVGIDNTMYAGGVFTTANGVTVNGITKWTGATFAAMSSGVAGGGTEVFAIAVGPDNRVYLGGSFATAGGVSCANIAVWNGVGYAPLGSGANYAVLSLAFSPVGILHAGGIFTVIGGITVPDSLAIWTGSVWLPMDIDEPGAPTYNYAILFDPRGNLYLGIDSVAGSAYGATVTVSANASTKTYPYFFISGPGKLYQIINYTTGRAIYFNNLTLLTGEICWLQLKPGEVNFWSTWRGLLNNYILNGSNLDFYLQPGNNNISGYVTGGGATTATWMGWHNTFWSNNGVA